MIMLELEHIGDDIVSYVRYGERSNPLYDHLVLRGYHNPALIPGVWRKEGDQLIKLHGIRDYSRATRLGRRGIIERFFLGPGTYFVRERISLKRVREYEIVVGQDE